MSPTVFRLRKAASKTHESRSIFLSSPTRGEFYHQVCEGKSGREMRRFSGNTGSVFSTKPMVFRIFRPCRRPQGMRNLVEEIEALRLHEEESRGENGVFPVAIPDECLDAFRAFRDEIIAI